MLFTNALESMARHYGLDPSCRNTLRALNAYRRGENLSIEHLRFLAMGEGRRGMVYNPKDGSEQGPVPHIRFNYAATKPLLVPVQDAAVALETNFRENIGRGAGPNAEIMTETLEEARVAVGEFFGYDRDRHVVIFTPNTSYGMFTLISMAARDPLTLFLICPASHHSTMLPARESGHYDYFRLNPNGTYDLNDIESKLKGHSRDRHAILCIESSSNVTGYKNPIAEICRIAARYDAPVFIDHAQGASSMPVDLSSLPGRVSLAVSGHKLYARDGSGAIVGPRELFQGPALHPAGGTITGVTLQEIFYAEPPGNLEAGTPSYVAQASLGKAAIVLSQAGLIEIEKEEERLTRLLMAGMTKVPGLEVLGEPDLDIVRRGPVVSFTLRGRDGEKIPPGFILKALEVFYGVDSRPGQFCSHPFIYFLLGASQVDALAHAEAHQRRGRAGCAALVGDKDFHAARISFGFPTKEDHILSLPRMLSEARAMWPDGSALRLDPEAGEFYFPGRSRRLTEGDFSLHKNGPYGPF